MSFTKEQAKEKIRELIEKFKRESETGKTKHFSEAQTVEYYIRPFFEYLNWDFTSSDEVIPQEKASKGWVDYGFISDGISKFYVEAKAVREDLNDIKYIKQAISYASSKSVTWAILTNFRELKVFNAEWESKNPRDKIYIPLTWEQYLDKFDSIWLLSKDSFLKNELDKDAEEHGKKIRKTPVTPVMTQLFNDLIVWREKLTKSISSYSFNDEIVKSKEELDEYVQRIIDKLIFIRVCEDRYIEKTILQSIARMWLINHKRSLIHDLNKIFRDFDKGYNSKLFAPHPSEKLKIDDVVLVDIINNLYESSDGAFNYGFHAFDVDVLGIIYEEYLGYILRKSKKKAGIKENHAYRKEMGIYYTPTFIVDYIVKNTVGRLAETKPKEIDDIKILDMACGSGSFLLKSFDFLLNYHKNKNEFDFSRKKDILTTNIYGVDLDPKAIEMAQLNLLLKAVEKRRLLPELQNNLKIGNSLTNDQKVDRYFDWATEFKEIMDNGGFDVVIGNPPYVDSEEMTRSQPKLRELYSKNYESAKGNWDLFCLFLERGLNLLRKGGYLGMIVPNKLLSADYSEAIRKIIQRNKIIAIRDYSKIPVFHASVYPIVIIVQKAPPKDNKPLIEVMDSENEGIKVISSREVEQRLLEKMPTWSPVLYESGSDILNKIINQSIKLNEIAEVYGASTVSQAYEIKNLLVELSNQKNYFKFINTGTIDRYSSLWNSKSTQYIKSKFNKPIVTKDDMKKFSDKRYNQSMKAKIIIGGMSKFLECYLDDGGYLAGKSTTIVLSEKTNLKFLLAVLNSKLMTFCYKNLFKSLSLSGGYMRIGTPQIKNLPIKMPTNKQEKEIIELVDKILELNKEPSKINPKSNRGVRLQEEIDRVDKEIDQEVYELYSLSKEEVRIVENS